MNISTISFKTLPEGASVERHVHLADGTTEGVSVLRVRASVENGTFDANEAIRAVLDIADGVRACMADVLYIPHWCRPEFFTELGATPEKTQALLWQCADGSYGAILPLCADGFICTLEGRDGTLQLKMTTYESGTSVCDTAAAVFGRGSDPYRLLADLAKEAALLCGTKLRDERAYPDIFEYLGWCSWDAMEIWVNEQDLLRKCREFKDKGLPIRWAILDDMWADVDWIKKLPPFTDHSISFPTMHQSRLHDLEADPERFPEGLAHTIAEMKKFGLQIGIWHPVTGYWSGLTEGSPAHEKFAPYVHKVGGRVYPDLRDEDKVFGFFSTWHQFLKECGATFMKVDNQSFLRLTYTGVMPLGKAARNLHAGLDRSIETHFGGALINCMGMANEDMFTRPSTAVSRCSGDFQPENRAWFARHVLACAYNGLFQGQFFYNDWDMFWTDDTQALRNSVVHAVSGGPIYVSDKLDRTVADVLMPLCLDDGRILRCDEVAVPAREWLCADPREGDRAFGIVNRAGETVYYAAFNLSNDNVPVSGSFRPSDLSFEGDVILYEYFSGECRKLSADERYEFALADNDATKLFSLTPYTGETVVIGLAEKMIAAKTFTREGDEITPLCDGTLVVYSEQALHFDGVMPKVVNNVVYIDVRKARSVFIDR